MAIPNDDDLSHELDPSAYDEVSIHDRTATGCRFWRGQIGRGFHTDGVQRLVMVLDHNDGRETYIVLDTPAACLDLMWAISGAAAETWPNAAKEFRGLAADLAGHLSACPDDDQP